MPDHPLPDGPRWVPDPERADTLAGLAEALGVPMPPFEGPLVAFQFAGARGLEDPVFLGGDLHAVHPHGGDPAPDAGRDPTLDQATVTLTDHEHEAFEIVAVEGIWCTRMPAAGHPTAPYLSVIDSDGRSRARLLLPLPYLMVDIAHLWLPVVPSPAGPPIAGSSAPGDAPRS